MNGHPTPRRPAVGPHLLFLLLLALLTCSLAFAGCEADADDTADSGGVIGDAAVSATESTAPEPAEGSFPVTVTDDVGSSVTVATKPMRIVSTAPSNTQILFALGVGDRVVGVNSLDDYPAEVADIAKVGDYQVNTEAVMALSPDLVVGYSGNEEGLAPVQEAGAPVLILNPTTVEGIYANITTIGAATGATGEAAELVESIGTSITEIAQQAAAAGEAPTVFYIVDNTLWTCGPGSFVDELLTLANATNAAATAGGADAQAYYQLAPEQLLAADPEVIVLSGLAYAGADEFTSDARFAGLTAVKEGRVFLIAAEHDKLITVPGPRIAEGLRALVEAIHPGAL